MGSDLLEVWLLLQLKQQYHSLKEPTDLRAGLGCAHFVEHIRKLTIKFICLFQFRFSNTITICPLKGWGTLSVFLLTIYVSIEVSRISLNVTNQVIDIQIMLLFDIGLYFPSQSFKFWPKLILQVFFTFACVLFLLRIFLLISGVIQGTIKIPTYWFAGNDDRCKSFNEFEFRPDRTFHCRVIRPWACPLTLNGENGVSIFSQLLWIQSSSNLQVTRTGIKSWMSLNFDRIRTVILQVRALERWKKCLQVFSVTFDWIFGNKDRHKSWNEFKFGPDRIISSPVQKYRYSYSSQHGVSVAQNFKVFKSLYLLKL